MRRGLIHTVLFLRPQLSRGVGQGVTPGDRVDVEISVSKIRAPESPGGFSKGQTLGPHPSPMTEASLRPPPTPAESHSYSELAGGLSDLSLAAQVWIQGSPLTNRGPQAHFEPWFQWRVLTCRVVVRIKGRSPTNVFSPLPGDSMCSDIVSSKG